MSLDQLDRFVAEASRDEDLRNRLLAAISADEVMAIARDAGHVLEERDAEVYVEQRDRDVAERREGPVSSS